MFVEPEVNGGRFRMPQALPSRDARKSMTRGAA